MGIRWSMDRPCPHDATVWQLCRGRWYGGDWFRVFESLEGFEVHRTPRGGRGYVAVFWFCVPDRHEHLRNDGRVLQLKYIKKAQQLAGKYKKAELHMDPYLGEGRPALTEFMTETGGDNGTVREPSPLMIIASPDGVRVGLRDDDLGWWCWRSSGSLIAALDAIEKALQEGSATFGSAGKQNGRRGKR